MLLLPLLIFVYFDPKEAIKSLNLVDVVGYFDVSIKARELLLHLLRLLYFESQGVVKPLNLLQVRCCLALSLDFHS